LPPVARGELALVLHTHMPYVEGFGTWPFGEEWLWEAIATSYLPLLDVLGDQPLTLSLTPVLCDQLEAPGALERCRTFLRDVRAESHRRDIEEYRRRGEDELVHELERSAAEYASAAQRVGGDLLGLLGEHAGWTSSATHAVLPLLATNGGIALQVQTGVQAHRRRFGQWAGGFWLPECGYAPWLEPLLEDAGVHATCIELTSVFGPGDPRHLHPLRTEEGPVLWPLDRATIELVWGPQGYPSSAAYRSYHALTPRHHRVWRNDGAPYDHGQALALATEHARDFVARVQARVADGGVCVCALDTELLGHWWYEGVSWLGEVLRAAREAGLRLTTLDDAAANHQPRPAAALPVSSWGAGGDLRTWSGPQVSDLAWGARTAELEVAAAGRAPGDRVLRELLALQSSDWAFMVTRELAGAYPRERAAAHAAALREGLAGEPGDGALQNLAPELVGWER
jgi:1,4-alpha-glucan branching enzyme